MDPISDQALRAALDHETTSIVRQLQADNERLRNELATAKANLANRYLRSVLNLIDKHRDMGYAGLDVIDEVWCSTTRVAKRSERCSNSSIDFHSRASLPLSQCCAVSVIG